MCCWVELPGFQFGAQLQQQQDHRPHRDGLVFYGAPGPPGMLPRGGSDSTLSCLSLKKITNESVHRVKAKMMWSRARATVAYLLAVVGSSSCGSGA